VVVVMVIVMVMVVMMVMDDLRHGRAGHHESGKSDREQRLQHVRLLIRSVL
jgi:hypothetical protein